MKKSLFFLLTAFFVLSHIQSGAQDRSAQLKERMKKLSVSNKGTASTRHHSAASAFSNAVNSCGTDTILLTSQAQIDNYSTTYPTCTTPKYLLINGAGASPAITNVNGLLSITEVDVLEIRSTSIVNLNGLNNLTVIRDTIWLQNNTLLQHADLFNLNELGDIFIQNCTALNSINGWSNNLDTIGVVGIDSTALTSLGGFNHVAYIDGGLNISHSPIVSLSSLADLDYIRDYLYLDNDTLLTAIGLTHLHHCIGFLFGNTPRLTNLGPLTHHLDDQHIGTFWMIQTGLTSLAGLDSLKSSENFYLWLNHDLASLHGLEGLSDDVYWGFSIWANDQLTDITAIRNISSTTNGTVEISGQYHLTDLGGIHGIIDIGQGLWLNGLDNVTSLDSLNPALIIHNNEHDNNGNMIRDSLRIFDNYQLAVCASPPICNYLSTDGRAYFENNAPGCGNITEVVATCGIVILCPTPEEKTWNGSVSDDWDDANNWTPAGVPGVCTKVTIPLSGSIPNDPYIYSGNISIGGLIMESGAYLNMAGYNLAVTGIFNLDNAEINNVGAVVASKVYAPTVHGANIYGNFSCLDYGAHSEFLSNTIYGNTILSDSTGRSGSVSAFSNRFYGDLTFINNSDYGQSYLSNSSPGYDYVQGNLNVVNNSAADISVGLGGGIPLKIQGNFTVNASNGHIDIGRVAFVDNNVAHIINAGSLPITIEELYHQKNGWSLILDAPVDITNKLEFGSFSGGLVTSNSNLLTMRNNSYAVVGFSGGAVMGPLKKIGNSPFTFPIGKIEQNTFWVSPLTITAPSSATDAFTAEYFHHSPANDGYDTSLYAPGFGGVSGKDYWKLDRDNGFSKVKVTLAYDSFRSGVNYNFQTMQVANWQTNLWKSLGTGGFSGAIYGGTLQSGDSTTGGPLAFSYQPIRKPVITMSPFDSLRCLNTAFNVRYTLDTAMISNNLMRVEISDSSGHFNPTGFNPTFGSKYTSAVSDSILFYSTALYPNKHYKLRIVGDLPADTSVNVRDVIFTAYPTNALAVSGPNPYCLGMGVQKYYPNIKEPGVTYTWQITFGGTFTTNGDTALVTWTNTGYQTLYMTATNLCGSIYRNAYVEVRPAAPAATPVINNSGRWLYASQAPVNAGYAWYRNGTLIAGANNSSYYAHLAGNYTAKFANLCGDGPASNTISFAADGLSQTINFPPMANQTYGDAPFTPAATASSGLPVNFTIISGPATFNTTTNLLTIIGTGLVTVKAAQSGSNVYDTAATVTRSFTVFKAAQTITFPAIANQDFSNGSVAATASSNSNLAVSYTIVSGPATVSGSVVTFTGIGTVTVRAMQGGDTNYLAASPVDRSFCITVAALNPVSGFTNLCPATATYSVNNIQGATYFWRIVGGGTLPSTTNTVNINWTTPGLYTVLVSASGNCGAGSSNDTLVVNVINSIQPDSVQAMFPANNSINLELPLTLSWVPAQPNSYYTFDLYLWKAEDPQPATPYAANIPTVNYTLPLNSGLVYNHPYKWMIVSHNGSCTVIHTGPVQQFSLIPLPDLVVNNVQAPATAFSGQTVSINWTVTNPGPGKTTTNQSWTDAVFLSFDTIPNFTNPNLNPNLWGFLDFPIRPLLIGTKPNVSALDSGQHYTNSINFTLPLSYSRPLYVYVITNYPASASAPVQVTKVNDTARAPLPIDVTLSPTPDLRVDTVFTPSTTFSGSTISLTYKVKNYGVLTPSGTNWTDKFYISQSPLFNINTAIPLKSPKFNDTYYANALDAVLGISTQLQADSSYTRNANVVIPNYIFGTYFIYVLTNASSSLYEGASINNNVNRSQMQVFLTPTPHLTVSSLTLPITTASVTQPVGVNWNIANTGFNDNIEKNKGHYFIKTGDCLIYHFCSPAPNCPGCTCTPPPPSPGQILSDSTSFGGSYWQDKVYLSTDPSGLVVANSILVAQANQGIQYSGYYVSDNYTNPLAAGCLELWMNPSNFNANTSNVIRPASNHPQSSVFNIPPYLAPGNYYVYVLANSNKDVYEYPGLPEVRRSALPITVERPDLVVANISAPANTMAGQQFSFSYSITNNGPGGVFGATRNDRIYVSTSAVFDGSAQLVATQSYTENVPVGALIQHLVNYTFPVATSGTRYIYVHTNYDSAFRETNQNNNISSAAMIVVAPAVANDLVVSSVTLADTVFSVFPTNFKYRVANNASGTTAGVWTDQIFISCNPVFNVATSYVIGQRQHSEAITSGGSYSDSFNLSFPFQYNGCFPQLPNTTAYFFVKTNTDNGIYEGSNGNNNLTATGIRVLINPLVDHIVTSVTGSDSAIAGRPYQSGWTVKNIGYNSGAAYYYGWYDAIYFSPDSTFNANAVQANYFGSNNVLNTNQTYTESRLVTAPNLPTGDYYVFAKTNAYNSITGEISNNNTNLIRNGSGAAKKIHLVQPLLPDLADSILSAPSLVATGQPLTVKHRVTNKGVGATYPSSWTNDVWLSADFIPGNAGDVLLSSGVHNGSLNATQFYDDSASATINLNITPGNYVLISRVNATGNVYESNSSNNLAFRYVTIYRPAPADLVVESIMKPDTVFLGYTVDTAKWVIRNIANNAATGFSSDGIYLSHGTTLDSSATLIGIINKNINIAPLGRDTVSLRPLINNVTQGSYNVIVKTDLLNNIVESNKDNNTGVAVSQLYVDVKQLPMNVLTPNTLFNINRFYKLIIPDSLTGSTIQVILKSNDSLSMKNQMFIGKGYIPSAANFDYTYSTPNYGNQDIVMTSVTAGVYYISIRCVSASPVTQNITLKAVKLPFTILSVQSTSGGNTGNVTIRILGSLFTGNMAATLTRPGTTITATNIYYTNSTQVYATFNLQGKPLGTYDVTLIKPDTTMAVLSNGFAVVNANNGGLITGGAVNTGSGNGNAPGCDPGAASGLNAQLITEMVMQDQVLGGWVFVIQINFSNPTNVDIPAQSRILYSERDIKMALTQEGVAGSNGSTALYLELTEPGGPPGIVRAGGSGTILVYTKAPVTIPGHTRVYFNLR